MTQGHDTEHSAGKGIAMGVANDNVDHTQVLQSPLQLPMHGSNLIEASAGTGKTYTIAALYIRFILAHIPSRLSSAVPREKALLPPDILVVTFTKAATAELKDRIRERLVKAAAWFRDTDQATHADGFFTQLREQFEPAQWPQCAYALQMASEWMDEASVKTIHSWCQSLLKEHAFSSGSLFNQELTTELQRLRDDAARDYWREFIYPLQEADFLAVSAVAAEPLGLLKACFALWPLQPKQLPAPIDISALREQANAEYHAKILTEHRRWPALLEHLYNFVDEAEQQGWLLNKRKVAPKPTAKAFKAIAEWLELEPGEAIAQLPTVTSTLIHNYSRAGFAELVSVPTQHLPFLDQLQTLADLSKQGPSIREPLLKHAAQWMQNRYYQALHQNALMSFDDIIEQCRVALEGPQGALLAEQVRQQFPIAMVDEFQDTDPDQYAIFNAVYTLDTPRTNNAVYLIGDPKQAIYAFRGADIFTYLMARRDTQGSHFTLARNFRSTTQMVAASNAIFSWAEQTRSKKAFLFADQHENQVPFVEVQAQGQSSSLVIDGEPTDTALTLWLSHNEDTPQKPINVGDYNQQQAHACGSEIVRLLQGANAGLTGIQLSDGQFRPLQRADIAVLVNSGREGALVQQALRERGVASVYLSDRNSVFESAVAEDILRILLACAHPEQRQLVTNALYSAIFALPINELAALQHDDHAWDARVEQFYGYAQLWQSQGVLALLQRIVHDFQIASRLVQELGGERNMTDLLHIAELLQQAASKLDGEHALIRYLRDKIYQPGEDSSDEQTVRLESDSELVQIVTVHKSKGLEYPLVFLPFSSISRPVRNNRAIYSYHDAQGQRQHSSQATPEVLERVNEERLGEEIRRLYVALTRAKYATWASVATVKEWQQGAFAYLCQAEAVPEQEYPEHVRKAWQHAATINITALPTTTNDVWQAPVSTETQPQVCQMPAEHQFTPWWIASYSSLQYGALREPESASEAQLIEEEESTEGPINDEPRATEARIHHFPRGAGPGTFLHNLLEDAAEIGFADVALDPQQLSELIAKRCRHGTWQQHSETLQAWLASYLRTPLYLPDGSTFCLQELQNYQSEPEFWFHLNGVSTTAIDNLIAQHILPAYARPRLQTNYLQGMLKGFIDLVFEHEGRFYVADYKSNFLADNDQGYSQAAMRDKILSSRYDVQYAIYSLALHRLLQVRLGAAYQPEVHFGGVVYLFLRGHAAASRGAFTDALSVEFLQQLGQLMLAEPTLVPLSQETSACQ